MNRTPSERLTGTVAGLYADMLIVRDRLAAHPLTAHDAELAARILDHLSRECAEAAEMIAEAGMEGTST